MWDSRCVVCCVCVRVCVCVCVCVEGVCAGKAISTRFMTTICYCQVTYGGYILTYAVKVCYYML